MTFDEFRTLIEACLARGREESRNTKDPFKAVRRIVDFYRLHSHELPTKSFANIVVSEWLLSDDAALRTYARDIVRECDVVEAKSALEQLVKRLQVAPDRNHPSELVTVRELISELAKRP